ncbi:MAG: preprotein translocase subunit SecY [Candidatus Pacebacteria bacterium]|nr:preprotein translocase subunit SecY [Candidatus Paceibacterota bacterium]
MVSTFFRKLKIIAADVNLRNRVLFILGALLVFRLLAAVPIPGIDQNALQQFFSGNQFLGLLNIFSGGGLSGLSIVMLGVGPYITASIIMQLLTIMSPKLKAMYHEEGDAGRKRFSQYSRAISVPLAVIQGLGFIVLLESQGILPNLDTFQFIVNLIVITAGSVLLMWIGELMSEFGIGNGMSLMIFAGIVAGFPNAIQQILFTYSPDQIPTYIAFVLTAVLIIIGVVFITEAERPVPVTYAKQVHGGKSVSGGTSTYIPLRLNQAGVIPIIFALSTLLLPQMLVSFLGVIDNATLQTVLRAMSAFTANQLAYGITYFLLVFFFTYFYTAVTFDPDAMSKNLQKSGAFILGVRPGDSTAKHIGNIVSRVTFWGALFLGLVAVIPLIAQSLSGITSLTIGGTSLLIAVSVIIDLIKKIDAQLSLREY